MSDPRGPELETVMSCHVNAGHENPGLLEERLVLLTTEPFLQAQEQPFIKTNLLASEMDHLVILRLPVLSPKASKEEGKN